MIWFELHVNSDAISRMVIRRVTNTGIDPARDEHAYDDMVSTYLVTVDGAEVGKVRHRYGDGPWVLARNATDMAVTPPGEMGGRAAAERLRCHESTIKNYAARGLLPYRTTPGGHRRYKAEDVDKIRPLIEAAREAKGMS